MRVTGFPWTLVHELQRNPRQLALRPAPSVRLDSPGTPVRVSEPFQMLGEVTPDLLDCLGIDAVRVGLPNNVYGFRNDDWKPWTTFDGTPVLVPGKFPTEPEANGDLLMYPRATGPLHRVPACRRRLLLRLDHPPGAPGHGAPRPGRQLGGVRARSTMRR